MVALLLEQNGVEVIQADDGVQASELGMKADFDALVSDLHMPNMGGVALAKALRERPSLRTTRPRFIALTASSLLAERSVARRILD